MNRSLFTCAAALGWLVLPLIATATDWKPDLMDRDLEIDEALAAGPETIRESAGAYVLTASGYELARQSDNGFHCIVGRSQRDSYEPQCFDAEGSETLLKQVLLRGRLQMSGEAPEAIQEALNAAWASGELEAPSRPGINYMLSENNRVPIGPDKVIPYGPHLMFYAPNLTDADVGGDRTGQASPVFMINPGKPSGYVIVPVEGH